MKKIKAMMLSKKDEGAKEIVIELGLIILVIALLVIFRTQISGLMTRFMNAANETINNQLLKTTT